MYFSINDVKTLDEYRLILIFENEEKKIFNMRPFLEKGIFKELQNKNMFNTVKVSLDTIEWANKADMDPEMLYEDSIPV